MDFTETSIKDLNTALNEAVILSVSFYLDKASIEITIAPVAVDEHNMIRKNNLVTLVFSEVSRFAVSFREGRWDDNDAAAIKLSPEDIHENINKYGQFAIYSQDFIDSKDKYFEGYERNLSFDYRSPKHALSKHTFEFTRDTDKSLIAKIWFDDLSILGPSGENLQPQELVDASGRAWSSPEILKKFGIIKLLP